MCVFVCVWGAESAVYCACVCVFFFFPPSESLTLSTSVSLCYVSLCHPLNLQWWTAVRSHHSTQPPVSLTVYESPQKPLLCQYGHGPHGSGEGIGCEKPHHGIWRNICFLVAHSCRCLHIALFRFHLLWTVSFCSVRSCIQFTAPVFEKTSSSPPKCLIYSRNKRSYRGQHITRVTALCCQL